MEDEEEQYRDFQHRKKIPKTGPIPLANKKKKGKKGKNSSANALD